MAERGRPKKERPQLVEMPQQFDADSEFGLTRNADGFRLALHARRVRSDGGGEEGRLQLPGDERVQTDERARSSERG